jgi:hypothetical protein
MALFNDKILDDKCELKVLRLLNRFELNDFWMTFCYLKDRVHLTELQALSICIRKFELKGAVDRKHYSEISFKISQMSYGLTGVYPFFTRNQTKQDLDIDYITLKFKKADSIPKHLQAIHSKILEANDYAMLAHLPRLVTHPTQEYEFNLHDLFVINIVRTLSTSTTYTGYLRLIDF